MSWPRYRPEQPSIALYGASGMIGSRIGAEAVARGSRVTGLTRSGGPDLPVGVTPRQGDARDDDDVARVAAEHDVVVCALSPSRAGGRHDDYLDAVSSLAHNVPPKRLVVVGTAGILRAAPGLRLVDTPAYPEDWRAESRTMVAAYDALRDAGGLVDWVYIAPPPSIVPGERTGRYRLGVDTPVAESISVEDFAVAVLDEIEHPRHRRELFTVAT